MRVELTLPYPPSLNRLHRHVGNRTLLSAEGRIYRQAVAGHVAMQTSHRFSKEDRLEVEVDAYVPDRRRRDIDNIPKALLDSLEHAGVFVNDSQIDRLLVTRKGRRPGGAVVVRIAEL